MFIFLKLLVFFCLLFCFPCCAEWIESNAVLSTKRIFLEEFPDAYNPSMIKIDSGYLLSFRYAPSPYVYTWLSYIGIVLLDECFEPISRPQLIKMRFSDNRIPSQAEDARLFSYNNRLYLTYNDNKDVCNPSFPHRRDIFIAELICTDGHYSLLAPLKLIYEKTYQMHLVQKNWMPFEYNGKLLIVYTVYPHEILVADLITGYCYPYRKSHSALSWKWGPLRGGSPPILDDGEYLSFFHSSRVMSSLASYGWDMWHYFMGAYTFSADPPFHITKISPFPIVDKEFYTPSDYYKRVIFPGACIISGPHIYVPYGKDDCEIWIATLDKAALKRSLVPVALHPNQDRD